MTAKLYNMAFWHCPVALMNEKHITYDVPSKKSMSLLYHFALKYNSVHTRAKRQLGLNI